MKFWILAVSIGLLLVCMFVGTASAKTWYVDDSGGADFTKIQDAINAANESDIIYVYDGMYYGAVNITKSVTLQGKNANTTIIHGQWLADKIINVSSNNITVNGFTVSGTAMEDAYGIYIISADYCNISNNIISDGDYGIYLTNSNYTIVAHNNASHLEYGIYLSSCNNCLVDGNIASSNAEYGIRLSSSSNNSIKDNEASDNNYGIYLHLSSNYNILTNNSANSNDDYGICVSSSSNNNITNNTVISNYGYGIYLSSSLKNKIIGNTINVNNYDGIYLSFSSNNNITGNIASNNDYGVHLESSLNNIIDTNIISYNNKGIYLYYSNNNLVYYNNILTNILQAYDHNGFNKWDNGPIIGGNYWSDCTCTGNPSNGTQPYTDIDTNTGAVDNYPFGDYCGGNPWKFVYVPDDYTEIQAAVNFCNPGDIIIVRDGTYTENVNLDKSLTVQSENGSITTTIQASNSDDHVFEVTKYYVNINGFMIKGAIENNKAGIYLGSDVHHCTIFGNNASNNNYGIRLYSSSSNITNNILSNNEYGIYLSSSMCRKNDILANNISNNRYGIYLSYSSNNNITDNILFENTYGIYLDYSSNSNMLASNSVFNNNGAGIRLYSSSNNKLRGNIVSNNGEGIGISLSSNNTITNNTMNSNYWGGIIIASSSNNTITNNTVNSNIQDGISLYSSSENNITNNNLLNNGYGINLKDYSSSNNLIYLNNFLNNSQNVHSGTQKNRWNSSLMLYDYKDKTYTNYLGNYWDDYYGSDTNSDGIGETPYSTDYLSSKLDIDYYPLIEPFENYLRHPAKGIFNTGGSINPYPSTLGTHRGKIKPNHDIIVNRMYTYPCPGTGGHTEYVKIWNSTNWNVTAMWNGYTGDWHNIAFDEQFTLYANETYNYTIITGSYPQIIHADSKDVTGGTITCEEFVDINGKRHEGWIPAIRLE